MTAGAETLIRAAAARLAAAGIEDARREAKLLLQHAADLTSEDLLREPEGRLTAAEVERFEAVLTRRAAREPFSLIVGRRDFWTLSFKVTADVLDPRPESECLIEAAIAGFPDRAAPLRILDLGTGSGCLLLSLLSEYPAAQGVGIDLSAAALAVARGNAMELGLAERCVWVRGHWAEALAGPFDLIVSNPPYVRLGDWATLQPEVRKFDPPLALFGGEDGLDAQRAIAQALPRLLSAEGRAMIECGMDQAAVVLGLLLDAGLDVQPPRLDLGGIARCLVAAPRREPFQSERKKALGIHTLRG